MAVAIARRVDADQAGTHLLLDTLAHPAFPIRDTMAHQLPPLPSIPSDQGGTVSPNFSMPVDRPPGPPGPPAPPGPEMSVKKRKASRGKMPSDLKRSQSTPQIRGLAMSETNAISPTIDKRRNKLGYHRTSVACGHCRRRKIRCVMPSPEDPQGRCANCIRLKKECLFYPVTEANQHEARTSSVSRKSTQTGPPSASTPASPRTTGTSNPGSTDEVRYPPSNPEILSTSQGEGYGVPITNGAQYPPSYGYQTFPSPEQWIAPGFPPSQPQVSSSQPESASSSQYWPPSHTVVSTAYQNTPTVTGGQVPSTPFESPGFSYNQSQNAQSWSQPRSLSVGHIEGMHHHYGYPQLSSHHPSQVPSPAYPPYAPQLPSNHPPAPVPETPTSAIHPPATAQSHPSYPAYPPTWTPYSQPAPVPSTHEPPTEAYQHSNWYSEASPHSKPNEAPPATGPQYAHPPAYYSHVSHP